MADRTRPLSASALPRPPVLARARRAGGAGPWRRAGQRLTRNPLALGAAFILALIVTACLAAPLIAALRGIDAFQVDLLNRLQPPGVTHWLGTDALGRDVLAQLLLAGRVSLTVGVLGALLAALIGTLIGLVAAYLGGRVDGALMRLTDAVIALPLLPLLIILAALDLDKIGLAGSLGDIARLVIIVALFGWTTTARLVRAEALSVRRRDYVRAAEALGQSPLAIMRRHILPNVSASIIVATTLAIGAIMLAESVLSFLGLGIQPPLTSWGGMLSNAQELLWQAPHLAIFPGLLIFLTVIAVNLLGDGLRSALHGGVTGM